MLNLTEPPWYGPVCPVVWEGRSREAPPYPDQPGDVLYVCKGDFLFFLAFFDKFPHRLFTPVRWSFIEQY